MDPKFAIVVEALQSKYEALVNARPMRPEQLRSKLRGVYLFSERGQHLYVGRSNDIRARYGRQCRPGATHRMAAFAFRLARESTGRHTPSYKNDEHSRAGLMRDPDFQEAFRRAKARIREMDFRCVEESDQQRQALLEIYCAIALDSPHNDFDTH